jgi:hypothetical protein
MWGRATAGVVPGFFVAAALVGWVCWSWPGPWQHTLVPGLVAFFPAWVGVICASFKFAGSVRAWSWLGALAVLGLCLLWTAQAAGWVR